MTTEAVSGAGSVSSVLLALTKANETLHTAVEVGRKVGAAVHIVRSIPAPVRVALKALILGRRGALLVPVAASLAVGAAVGVGVTLLVAPAKGAELRKSIRQRVARLVAGEEKPPSDDTEAIAHAI
jgi:hypothetical protein